MAEYVEFPTPEFLAEFEDLDSDEDVLLCIYHDTKGEGKDSVNISRLKEWTEAEPDEITEVLKELEEDGLIEGVSNDEIKLTDDGINDVEALVEELNDAEVSEDKE